jgi:hypothetical protein
MSSGFLSYNLGLPKFGTNTISSSNSGKGFFSFNSSPITGETAGWKQWLSYILAIAIVLFVILIFVHFFITPVFITRPGSSGYIPLPIMDDGKIYWKNDSTNIQDRTTPINNITQNFTVAADIFIENPLQISNNYRVLFFRGAAINSSPTSKMLNNILPSYNFAFALAPDTNDLVVSVMNSSTGANSNMENILIPNIPVQQTFRVCLVLMDHAMEVYIDGKLVKTRALKNPPKNVTGTIWAPDSTISSIAKVRNLHIWNRILAPSEIKASGPALA